MNKWKKKEKMWPLLTPFLLSCAIVKCDNLDKFGHQLNDGGFYEGHRVQNLNLHFCTSERFIWNVIKMKRLDFNIGRNDLPVDELRWLLWWLQTMEWFNLSVFCVFKVANTAGPFYNSEGCCSNETMENDCKTGWNFGCWSKLLDTSCLIARLDSDCGEEFLHVGAIPTDQLSRTFLLPVDLVFGIQFLLTFRFFFLKRFFSSFYYLFRIFFSFSFGFFSSVLRFPAHFGVKVFHLFSTFSPHFHWISVFVVGLCFIWWWKFVLPPSLIDFQLENFLAIEGAFSWVLNYTVFIFLYIYFRRV